MIEIFKEKVITYSDPYYITQGISNNINHEIRVKKGEYKESDYLYVLKYIIDYIIKETHTIANNQSIAFNSWVIKFRLSEKDDVFNLYELDKKCDRFVEGIEFSLSIMKNQIEVCEKYSSNFSFPYLNQKVVISDGVLEGYPVEAVRYESPNHMSGWWITTDLYNDDINTLKQVDLSELFLKRYDLIKYLALQNGFRFFMNQVNDDVWFDKEVLD